MVLVRRSFELSSSVYSLIRFFVAIFVYVQQCKMYCDWQCKDAVKLFECWFKELTVCAYPRYSRLQAIHTRTAPLHRWGPRICRHTLNTIQVGCIMCESARVSLTVDPSETFSVGTKYVRRWWRIIHWRLRRSNAITHSDCHSVCEKQSASAKIFNRMFFANLKKSVWK